MRMAAMIRLYAAITAPSSTIGQQVPSFHCQRFSTSRQGLSNVLAEEVVQGVFMFLDEAVETPLERSINECREIIKDIQAMRAKIQVALLEIEQCLNIK